MAGCGFEGDQGFDAGDFSSHGHSSNAQGPEFLSFVASDFLHNTVCTDRRTALSPHYHIIGKDCHECHMQGSIAPEVQTLHRPEHPASAAMGTPPARAARCGAGYLARTAVSNEPVCDGSPDRLGQGAG